MNVIVPSRPKAAEAAPVALLVKKKLYRLINEDFLSRNADMIFLCLFALFVATALLLFNTKLFLMGDDADYIMDAQYFVTQHIYPAGRSSLYAMVLGIFVAFGGISILQLKLFSLSCAIAAFCICYSTFKNRVPYWLLFITLLFTAINSDLQYYSSSNLSEAFFMMMQMIFFHATFLLYDRLKEPRGVRNIWLYWCYAGFAALLLSLSKNVAAASLLCLPVFFVLVRNTRAALLLLGIILSLKVLSEVLARTIYGSNTVVSQMGQVMAKNLYHPEYGTETFGGFVVRFFDNLRVYISKDLLVIFGFRNGAAASWTGLLWILPVSLLLFAIWKAYKHNRYLFFTGIYLCLMMGVSFLALQPAVAQTRIIVIYVPLLLCMLLYGLHFINVSRMVIPLIFIFILGVNLVRSLEKMKHNVPELLKNIQGDTYYGYTPDWVHYLQMGQYVASELPANVVVAARKPNSLTVYTGGRPFFGIYNVSVNATADELLAYAKANNIRYLILASLREYPSRAIPHKIVNTLHRYAKIIETKYPDKIHVVTVIGNTEPCYLLEIVN